MTKEERVSIRVKVRILADIVNVGGEYQHIKKEANASFKNITIVDISSGGMCLEITKELIEGSKLNLTIPTIENLPKSTIECTVTRSVIISHFTGPIKYLIGLKYNSPNTRYLNNLYEFVKLSQN